jgi:hypothetical protein
MATDGEPMLFSWMAPMNDANLRLASAGTPWRPFSIISPFSPIPNWDYLPRCALMLQCFLSLLSQQKPPFVIERTHAQAAGACDVSRDKCRQTVS